MSIVDDVKDAMDFAKKYDVPTHEGLMFDIFYEGENSLLLENFPLQKQVSSNEIKNPKTRMYWFIEPKH